MTTRNIMHRFLRRLMLSFVVIFCVSFTQFLFFNINSDVTQSIYNVINDGINSGDGMCLSSLTDGEHHARLRRDLEAGMTICADLRRPPADSIQTVDSWQRSSTSNYSVSVYSAFYDDRPAAGMFPTIRILGISTKIDVKITCHVWYADCESPYVTPATVQLTGRQNGYSINRIDYMQYLFSCQLPGVEPIPTHVSLAPEHCVSTTIYLPVQHQVRSAPDVEFGVCVAIAFGSIPVEVFVEWMEFGRLLGITEFNVYDAGMTNMAQAFQLYTSRRWLKVHHMPPPVRDVISNWSSYKHLPYAALNPVKLASPTSLNDCLLRNMYRYRYAVVIDFDEFIVPLLHNNYTQMISHISRRYNISEPHTYSFSNAYYFLDLEQDTTQPPYLRTTRYRLMTPPTAISTSPKSFVDPRTCLSVFNHYCYIPLRAAYSHPPGIEVGTAIARCHHYRRCGFKRSTCRELYQQSITDNSILRFKNKLQPVVEASLSELNWFNAVDHIKQNTQQS